MLIGVYFPQWFSSQEEQRTDAVVSALYQLSPYSILYAFQEELLILKQMVIFLSNM